MKKADERKRERERERERDREREREGQRESSCKQFSRSKGRRRIEEL